jgi:hypothetical protein
MASTMLSRQTQSVDLDIRLAPELREANRHLHEFLDWLGHELRSPLGAIRNRA